MLYNEAYSLFFKEKFIRMTTAIEKFNLNVIWLGEDAISRLGGGWLCQIEGVEILYRSSSFVAASRVFYAKIPVYITDGYFGTKAKQLSSFLTDGEMLLCPVWTTYVNSQSINKVNKYLPDSFFLNPNYSCSPTDSNGNYNDEFIESILSYLYENQSVMLSWYNELLLSKI